MLILLSIIMPKGKEEEGVLLLGTVWTLPRCVRQTVSVENGYDNIPAVTM